jgi:hypothetical protein
VRNALSLFPGVSIDEVVDSYCVFLARNHYDAHLDKFKQRLKSDARAAEAEAVVFSMLWSSKANPDLFENVGTGGPDFICRPNRAGKFLVEVKSLEPSAVLRRSCWPEENGGRRGGAFRMDTQKLKDAAVRANLQFRNCGLSVPRVLAITSSHENALVLMDCHAAESLLVSDPIPSIRLENAGMTATDLKNSVFTKPGDAGRIVPCLPHVSAVWLVGIFGDQSRLVGVLHPEPEIPFEPNLFPRVPYVRLRNWPILDGRMGVEWTPGKREPAGFYHARIGTSMANLSYFSVQCKACNEPIPLIEFDPDFHYRLPDSFVATHKTKDPRAGCEIPHRYTDQEVSREDLGRVPDFPPHPDFERLKVKR